MMLRVLLLSAVLILAVFTVQASNVESQNTNYKPENIRITIADDLVPYSYIDQHGHPKGLLVDYWKLWASKLNQKITFVPATWPGTLAALKDHKVDIHAGLFKLSSRNSYIEYLPEIYPTKSYFYVSNAQDHPININQLNQLQNKSVGLIADSLFESYILEHYPQLEVRRFDDFSELVTAINDGVIDMFFSESITFWFSLIKSLKYNDYIKVTGFELDQEFHAATPKGSYQLQQYIKLGMAQITTQELVSMERKWIVNPQLRTLSHPFDSSANTLLFTDQERYYIKHHPTLVVGVEAWQPIIYSDDGKKIKGIVGDLIELIAKTTGFKIVVVKDSWAHLMVDFKQQKIDLLPTAYFSDTRAEYGLFGDGYVFLASSIFTLKSNSEVNNLEDLNGQKIALVESDANVEFIQKIFPNINIVQVSDSDDMINRLVNGEVEAAFELDIVMRSALNNRLIDGIKAIPQIDMPPESLHFMTQKSQPLLHSILNKALASISKSRKNQIIDNWLGKTNIKKSHNLVFVTGRDPYTLDKQYLKGIEYDLIKRVFELSDTEINSVINLPLEQQKTALDNLPLVDVVVTVKEQVDNYFYSDSFISFNNVVVSRRSQQLDINHIDDLRDKKILAFDSASELLGEHYNQLFSTKNRPETYSEVIEQKYQVSALLAGTVDVIVLDLNIFKWLIRKAGYNELDQFKIDFIFPQRNDYKVAFRDKLMRDIFNKNLKILKDSGEFSHIISDYGDGNVEAKVELTSFISSLVSTLVFNGNERGLSQMVDVIVDLPYINKIEVFNNENKLLYASTDKNYSINKQQDSYIFLSGITLKVGRVKVYFNEIEVAKKLKLASLIPRIEYFKSSDHIHHIKNIYRRFNRLEGNITFSGAEQKYLDSDPVLQFSDVDWRPLSIIEGGNYSGMIADYMELITKLTGIEFEYVEHPNWQEVIEGFNSQQLDIVFSTTLVARSFSQSVISDEFANFNLAIVMANNQLFMGNINELIGKTIAVPKGYSSLLFLTQQHPELKLIETETISAALTLVREQKADAFVGHLAVVIDQLERNFPDLKIVGLLDEVYSHRMVLHQTDPLLLSIINKAFKAISPEQHRIIKGRWINRDLNTAVDYRLIYQILAVFMVILALIFVVFKKLAAAKNEIEQTNHNMSNTLAALEEQKHIFEKLFYGTADGLLLMIEDMLIDCNGAALKLLGIDSKTELLNSHLLNISPKIQPDGIASAIKYRENAELCKKNGHHRFEWVYRHKENGELWVEVVMTTIELNQQEIMHVVLRDISDKKRLEHQNLIRNQELEVTNVELERSLFNLKQAQKKLVESEKMASLGGLVAGVAHEINTPVGIGLTAITHFVEITRELKQKYQQKKMSQKDFDRYLIDSTEAASIINRNLERTAELVRSFKQISVDQSSDERRSFKVKEYINEILLSINHLIKKSKVDIRVSCDERLEIDSYPGAFSQIISNLLINSTIHAYPNNEVGVINIAIAQDNGLISLNYKDDGRGINGEHLDKIFEPFFTTNRDHGGSGLGLNIIYNIVTGRLNGKIECHSELGVGTEFIIDFEAKIIS